MTTPPVPSVLNPDITPPPRPIILAPSGNRFWPPSNDKGKAVAFDVPERRPSPDGNAAAIKSSPSRFHAAAYLHDVPAAFKEKFTTNRTMYDEVDRALFRYSSYGSRARCEGSGDNKRILVSFFVQEDHSTCVQSPCADLLDLEVSLLNWTPSLPRLHLLPLNELQQFYDGWISGTSPPVSAINDNNPSISPSFNHCFDISPNQFDRELNFSNILRIGTLNVRSLVHASKQFNLFSLLLSYQLHGLILTETNLQSPSYKYVCEPYLSQYNYHKWFSFSSSANHHAGVGILLHSSLAMYNLLIIGAYVPPSSGLNNKLIAECHSTLISWITSARATGTHIILGGDLNASFDAFIKHISNDDIRSPSHLLFWFLHTHQFDDLCALDPSTSLPLPTFTSANSG
ncbi:hypothetical protein RhiirA4_478303 [Rhizophagus irregularis]|uniref:Endonuclease/exonuclease/phosphatase domain-containing protein n=1 Tax=Rhizophagus irregularis TaxID=588596 RepID=A0A2I1HEL2_9GLOM|nr:hypothetical protein RhiirA4_478303 [Rhizophagus irregularis]